MAIFLNKSFAGTDDTLITALDASWVRANTGRYTGTPRLKNNSLYSTPIGGVRNTVVPPSHNYEVAATVVRESKDAGMIHLMARYRESGVAGAPSGYGLQYSSWGYFRLIKYNYGYEDALIDSTLGPSFSTGATIKVRLRVVENVLSVFFNDETSPTHTYTDTSSPILAAGSVGIVVDIANPDDFVATKSFTAETIEVEEDTDPPEITLVSLAGSGESGVSLGFTSSEAGVVHAIAYPAAQHPTIPTIAQILAGQDTTDAPALQSLSASSIAIGINTKIMNSIGSGVNVRVAFIAEDVSGNRTTPIVTNAVVTAETDPPVWEGAIAIASVTQNSATASWPAATDASGILRYEYSIDNRATWVSLGNVLAGTFAGLSPGMVDHPVIVRALDSNLIPTEKTVLVTTWKQGALGSFIRSTLGPNEDGFASVAYNDLASDGSDDAKWVRAEVVTPPTNALDFTFNPDGSFEYKGTAVDNFSYRLLINNVPHSSGLASVGLYQNAPVIDPTDPEWPVEPGENSNFILSSELITALAGSGTKSEWANALATALGSNRRVIIKYLEGAGDVWASGTTVLDATISGLMPVLTGKAFLTGIFATASTQLSADLTLGRAVLRVSSVSNPNLWVQGTFGLFGSGCDFRVRSSPTANTGFVFAAACAINAPSNLP